MHTIEPSDDMYARVRAFMPVARAVLDQDVDVETCFGLVLELGLRGGPNSVIQNQEEPTLVQAFHQLAEIVPHAVYGHVADRVALGADIGAHEQRQRQIGFGRR